MNTMNGKRRLEFKLYSKPYTTAPSEDKTMCLTKINKFFEIEKGLCN
jgi:hypothetical protein